VEDELPCPQAASKMRKITNREKTAVFIRIFVFPDE
jgi:hypothetical protein